MSLPSLTFVLAPLALVAGALTLSACDKDTAHLEGELDRLHKEVKLAREERDTLLRRLDDLDRRLPAADRDRPRATPAPAPLAVRVAGPGAVAAVAQPAAAGHAAPGAPVVVPEGFVAFLSTEEGQRAVEEALRAVEDRRRDERQRALVSRLVGGFAERAQLTQDQQRRMTDILASNLNAARDVWGGMRDAGDMTPDERAVARETNMRRMEEMRATTDNEVKAVLSSVQYEMYQQESERMLGALRGGGMGGAVVRPSGPGGFGGRRGLGEQGSEPGAPGRGGRQRGQ
jgi:hypothetical protein